MRTTLALVLATAMAGCAAHPKLAQHPRPSEKGDAAVATAPSSAVSKELGGGAVKIVAHRPAGHYKLVGRIEARATSGDIVDAALAADADVRRQAKALGADVIKLDLVAPPRRGRVILAGRAYKKSS
jgi:hypothetical protein